MPKVCAQDGVCGVHAPTRGGIPPRMPPTEQFVWDGFRRLVGWAGVLRPTYSIPLDAQTLRLGQGGRGHAQICIPRWGVRRVCSPGGETRRTALKDNFPK